MKVVQRFVNAHQRKVLLLKTSNLIEEHRNFLAQNFEQAHRKTGWAFLSSALHQLEDHNRKGALRCFVEAEQRVIERFRSQLTSTLSVVEIEYSKCVIWSMRVALLHESRNLQRWRLKSLCSL